MNNAKKYLVAAALAGSVISALPTFALAGGTGGSIIGNGSFNNGGSKAGNGGSGANGGNGGNVTATGSDSNGGAAAGTGGAGGSVAQSVIDRTSRVLNSNTLRSRIVR
jgi:hypothetical protein